MAAATFLSFDKIPNSVKLDGFLLANVEALADDESGDDIRKDHKEYSDVEVTLWDGTKEKRKCCLQKKDNECNKTQVGCLGNYEGD